VHYVSLKNFEKGCMNKRALVVDDDPTIREMVRAILEQDGYTVLVAEDGTQGVEILEREPRPIQLTIVLLDIMMPGMSGLDVLTRMKLHPHTKDLPVLMLTAESKPEDILTGYTTGADYYVTKPFTRQQLLKGIQYALTGGAES
jgi:two-component system phosphate regulon response regulator PhoB